MREVAHDVFCFEGTDVNWILVRDGSDLTLIDAGWSGDTSRVLESIRTLGRRPEDVQAVLLTHAHLDHMGAIGHLHREYDTPVYMDPREVPQACSGHLEQASAIDVLRRAYRPSVLRWSARIARAGALKPIELPYAAAFPTREALDLPGRPVPVPCPGHTSGHSAYHLPGTGVVVTGDALVTGHPLSRRSGPQLLPSFFSHRPADTLAVLDSLAALDGDVLLPGHGKPWHGTMPAAIEQAREHR